MTEFSEKDALGGWSIVVTLNGETLGHIREIGAGGGFGYYKGSNNLLTWSIQDHDLDSMKVKVDVMVRGL